MPSATAKGPASPEPLRTEDEPTRREVVLAGHLGDEPVVQAGLKATDPAVRASALSGLARLDVLEVADLVRCFEDGSPLVRRRVCELACRQPGGGNPQVLALLAEGLTDPDATVVEAACFALGEAASEGPGEAGSEGPGEAGSEGPGEAGSDGPGEAGGDGPATDVADAIPLGSLATVTGGHPDPLCREAAVAALGAIGDRRGLPAILDATKDKPAIRRRAVLALAAFDGPEVEEALARARNDRDWQVRQAAEDLT